MRQDFIPHWSLHELVLMGRWIEESWGEMRGYDLVVDGRYRLAGVVNFPTQSLLLRAIIESSWKILACVCPPKKRTVATRAVGVGLMNLLSHLPRELVNSTVASAAEVGPVIVGEPNALYIDLPLALTSRRTVGSDRK